MTEVIPLALADFLETADRLGHRRHLAGMTYPEMRLDEKYGLVELVRAVRRLPLWATV